MRWSPFLRLFFRVRPPPVSVSPPDFERAGGREPWSPSPANASPSDLRLAPTTFAPLSLSLSLSIAEWIIARFIVDEEREGRTGASQSASSSSTSSPTSSRRQGSALLSTQSNSLANFRVVGKIGLPLRLVCGRRRVRGRPHKPVGGARLDI